MRFTKVLPAVAAALVVAAGCGGNGEPEADEAPAGDPAAGRTVFLETAEPTCGTCHTLADAGTAGTVGVNLDERQPTADEVRSALEEGPDAMPSYAEQLSEEQMNDVAAYVADASGGER